VNFKFIASTHACMLITLFMFGYHRWQAVGIMSMNTEKRK